MITYVETPMPHLLIKDDGVLPNISNKIFDFIRKSKNLTTLLSLIRDRKIHIHVNWEDTTLQTWVEKGFVFAGKDDLGEMKFLALTDVINMEHSAIAESTFMKEDEQNQDMLMHFGFEEFQHLSILEFATLLSFSLIDVADVYLYRDYSNYKSGFVKHFLTSEESSDNNHLLVMNITQTITSYLVDSANELTTSNSEFFSQKVVEWIYETRNGLAFPFIYLRQNDRCYSELLIRCIGHGEHVSRNKKDIKLMFLKAQMKSLLEQSKFESAAQVREKIKQLNN